MMKFFKKRKESKHKRLKAALDKARGEVKLLRRKLVSAARRYKESVDMERIKAAEKISNKGSSQQS